MLPYVLAFGITIALTFIGQMLFEKKKKTAIILFSMATIFLSVFAAMRDYSVGADLIEYKSNYYDKSVYYDNFLDYIAINNNELGFQTLVYLSSHLFGDFRVLLFITSLISISLVYVNVLKINKKYITIAIAVYLMMFFNSSLNVMRQSMAISFTLSAFTLLCKDKKVLSILMIIIASLFHTSALIMLVIYPLKYISGKKKKQLLYSTLFIILFFAIASVVNTMQEYTDVLPGIITKYFGYIRSGETNLNIKFLLVKLLFAGFLFSYYNSVKENRIARNLYYFVIFDVLFYFFSNYIQYGYRLSYYFVIFYAILIPIIDNKLMGDDKKVFRFIIVALLVGYWLSRNIFIGYDQTVPYLIGAQS